MSTPWVMALMALVVAAIAVWLRTGIVTGAEARRLVAEGATLLDVRTREEFAASHVEGALNIPVQELPGRIGEVGAKDRAVVVYCRSGVRSRRAKQVLTQAGYAAHDLGSMSRW